jgi:hypothetical protein
MKMFPISCEVARDKHGITCEHSIAENGEFRFRLKKADGTAYIRTESPSEGGWQDSHYHKKVLETYIVQSGWMGYAVRTSSGPDIAIYRAGELFTTAPEIIHNVYLPKNSVIHTVKHGDAIGEDRLEDERTFAFTALTKKISETEILAQPRRIATMEKSVANGAYSPAYLHFDNLIWQIPVWSSAVFTLAIVGTSAINDTLAHDIGIPTKILLSSFYGLIGLFLLIASYALHRFRWHQIRAKNYTPSWKHPSPQIGLQFIVNLQASALIFLAFVIQQFPIACGLIVSALLLGLLSYKCERKLLEEGATGGRPIETRS